jgi:hypothetical protein
VKRAFGLLNAGIAIVILDLISRVRLTPCIIFVMLFVVVFIDNLMNGGMKLRLTMDYNKRAFALQQAQGDESQTG